MSMTGKSKLFLCLFIILFSSLAQAQLLVSITPKDNAQEVVTLYVDEAAEYELTVFNSGTTAAENISLKVSVAEGLKIVEGSSEKDSAATAIEAVQPGSRETVLLKVKPWQYSTEKQYIYVNYGLGEYTHLVATYLEVRQSPLQINARLAATALDVGGEGAVVIDLRNSSQEELRNIKAELLVPKGIESLSEPFYLDKLPAGVGYDEQSFGFRAQPTELGKRVVSIRISFEDSRGKHVVEKNFPIEIQSRQFILYIIIGVIVVLVAISILTRRKPPEKPKELEKPIVKELISEEKKAPAEEEPQQQTSTTSRLCSL